MTKQDVVDIAAGSTGLAVYLKWLPEIAAILTIVWGIIRIYEWARVRIFGYPPDGLSK